MEDGFAKVSDLQMSWGATHSKTMTLFERSRRNKDLLEEVVKKLGFMPVKKLIDGDYIHVSILTPFCCWMSPSFDSAHTLHSWKQPAMSAFQTALACARSDVENGLVNAVEKVKAVIDAKNAEFQETASSMETRIVSQLYLNLPIPAHDDACRSVCAIVGKSVADAQGHLVRSVFDQLSSLVSTYYNDQGVFRLTQAARDYINATLEDLLIRLPILAEPPICEAANDSYDFEQMLKSMDFSMEPDTNMLSSFMNS
eukprot:jgi/Mesvir1/12679/Mv01678-RA.1